MRADRSRGGGILHTRDTSGRLTRCSTSCRYSSGTWSSRRLAKGLAPCTRARFLSSATAASSRAAFLFSELGRGGWLALAGEPKVATRGGGGLKGCTEGEVATAPPPTVVCFALASLAPAAGASAFPATFANLFSPRQNAASGSRRPPGRPRPPRPRCGPISALGARPERPPSRRSCVRRSLSTDRREAENRNRVRRSCVRRTRYFNKNSLVALLHVPHTRRALYLPTTNYIPVVLNFLPRPLPTDVSAGWPLWPWLTFTRK